MQKFTRALTREIEVNGERLAVTLSETGVSFRPVGSRKPPIETTWAAIVGSAKGQPSASPPPPVAAPSAETPELSSLLQRLDAWLTKNRPEFFEGLNDGVPDGSLKKLATSLDKPVPPELVTWLAWHDGQGEEEFGSLVGAFTLISADEIYLEYNERRKGTDGPWNAGWIPFLDDFTGNLICLDTTRPGNPVVEMWRGREKPVEVAPSLTAWVTKLVSDLEAGNYAEDPERGEMLKKS